MQDTEILKADSQSRWLSQTPDPFALERRGPYVTRGV